MGDLSFSVSGVGYVFMIPSRCCRLRARCCSRVTLVAATGWQHACCRAGAACRELAARCELRRSVCMDSGRTRAAMIAILRDDLLVFTLMLAEAFGRRQVSITFDACMPGQLSQHLNPCASVRLGVVDICLHNACTDARSWTAAQMTTVCQVSLTSQVSLTILPPSLTCAC